MPCLRPQEAKDVTVRDLLLAFGDRSLGALLVLPCILVMLPIGMIPGVPDIAAAMMIVIAAQMVVGMDRALVARAFGGGKQSRGTGSRRFCAGRGAGRPGWIHFSADASRGLPKARFASETIAAVTIAASLVIFVIGIVPGFAGPCLSADPFVQPRGPGQKRPPDPPWLRALRRCGRRDSGLFLERNTARLLLSGGS